MSIDIARMKKWVVAGAAFSALALGSGAASADYVCSASYRPINSTSTGSEGYIVFSLYTETACSGDLIQSYYMSSTGATSTSCATSSYRWERQGLLAMIGALQRAASDNQSVNPTVTTCNGGASGCLAYPKFASD
jgi:hypothetical protein